MEGMGAVSVSVAVEEAGARAKLLFLIAVKTSFTKGSVSMQISKGHSQRCWNAQSPTILEKVREQLQTVALDACLRLVRDNEGNDIVGEHFGVGVRAAQVSTGNVRPR